MSETPLQINDPIIPAAIRAAIVDYLGDTSPSRCVVYWMKCEVRKFSWFTLNSPRRIVDEWWLFIDGDFVESFFF
jgi:hypothetical protein